ncbi:MAG: hypothetical protein LBI39_04220 [Puniceicoccales bacterium]|nr:hypothetical protein [Puniceicoccales bacterium]
MERLSEFRSGYVMRGTHFGIGLKQSVMHANIRIPIWDGSKTLPKSPLVGPNQNEQGFLLRISGFSLWNSSERHFLKSMPNSMGFVQVCGFFLSFAAFAFGTTRKVARHWHLSFGGESCAVFL